MAIWVSLCKGIQPHAPLFNDLSYSFCAWGDFKSRAKKDFRGGKQKQRRTCSELIREMRQFVWHGAVNQTSGATDETELLSYFFQIKFDQFHAPFKSMSTKTYDHSFNPKTHPGIFGLDLGYTKEPVRTTHRLSSHSLKF